MTAALALLAALAAHPSQTTTGIGVGVFGLGFGMVGQVLIVAVQNSVERRQLGVAMATTSFFRGLGGAVGAAALGAVFAAHARTIAPGGTVARLNAGARHDVIDGVQTVLLVATPIAALALALAFLLDEVPLRGPARAEGGREPQTAAKRPAVASGSPERAGSAT